LRAPISSVVAVVDVSEFVKAAVAELVSHFVWADNAVSLRE
jgi:hypothetical protein